MVRLGTQVLEDLSLVFYTQMVSAYFNKSRLDVEKYGSEITMLLTDMDALLATDQYSLLGRWIQSARSMGDSLNEMKLLEYNAKNQITLWGPTGQIRDYANKNWAGLLNSFYSNRWDMFSTFLSDSLQSDVPYNDTAFISRLLPFEEKWNLDSKEFPTEPIGDAFEVSRQLLSKYQNVFESESFKKHIETVYKNSPLPSLYRKMFAHRQEIYV